MITFFNGRLQVETVNQFYWIEQDRAFTGLDRGELEELRDAIDKALNVSQIELDAESDSDDA